MNDKVKVLYLLKLDNTDQFLQRLANDSAAFWSYVDMVSASGYASKDAVSKTIVKKLTIEALK